MYSMFVAGQRVKAPLLIRSGISGLEVTYATDEKMLFEELVTIIRRCVYKLLPLVFIECFTTASI